MSAIEAIRERCDESAKALREALVEYRKRNTSVPYALEADQRPITVNDSWLVVAPRPWTVAPPGR
jgi:hypothetical protein